jgi:chromate transporter
MLDEVVERRGWITREHFMHLVGVTNLLPGPNSSEVAIHIGYTQRGWRGAMATGLSFLLPTLILVTLFSALYFRYGSLPATGDLFWGLKPAILAVIMAAGWKLGKTALGLPETFNPLLTALALGGILVSTFSAGWEVPAMLVGGVLAWLRFREPKGPTDESSSGPRLTGLVLLPLSFVGAPASGMALGVLGKIFLLTLGSGAVLFGGGYMLVALIEPFVVDTFGWVTEGQFLDGIALTQAVPGPIVTLVAFVGYAAAGVAGAVIATVGIYLPSFAAVLAVAPHLEKWRGAPGFRAALRGVNAVVAGAILGVGLTLLRAGLADIVAGGLFLVALLALVRRRVPALWIVAGGLLAGGIRLVLNLS